LLKDDVNDFLLDEALGFRLVTAAKPRHSSGLAYESPADIPIAGPVAPGPAAHLLTHG